MRTTLLQTLSRMEKRENGALKKSLLLAMLLIALMFMTYQLQVAYSGTSLIPLPSDPNEAFQMLLLGPPLKFLLLCFLLGMGYSVCGISLSLAFYLPRFFILFYRTRKNEDRTLAQYTKSGIDLNDPKLKFEISEKFKEDNNKDDDLFIENLKAEYERKQIIEDIRLKEQLEKDLRSQEHLHSFEVKRIYDEYHSSCKK